MAEPVISSELEDEGSSPQDLPAPVPPIPVARSKGKSSKNRKSAKGKAPAKDRYALRRHNALERQYNKARQSSHVRSPPGISADPATPPLPVFGNLPHHLPPGAPIAPHEVGSDHQEIVRPTTMEVPVMVHRAAETDPEGEPELSEPQIMPDQPPAGPSTTPDPPVNVQAMLSDVLAKILSTGLQQGVQQGQHAPLQSVRRGQASGPSSSSAPQASVSSDESEMGEELPEEMEFSEDENFVPDQPVFTGLFRPSVFRSLLHKAKLITKFGLTPSETSRTTSLHDPLFQVSKPDKDTIPCPPLFSEVVKSGWAQPGALTAPSALDKKLYCSAPELEDILALPSVDAPVAALSSSSVITSDVVDGLKAEDRKTELTFRKTHQAAAWAVKAATSTSFFTRASLLWLRQLQERLPADDIRLHHDVNKLVAAAEYSADASLNAAKFASRALSSTVTSRRLFWLRNWRADAKTKWKLASAPYASSQLFGAALEPLLIEDKNKRKILPSSYRRHERRFSPYSQRQSFRPYSGSGMAYQQRSYQQGPDRFADRQSFRDRGRSQSQSKRPFRGAGYRPFRRGK